MKTLFEKLQSVLDERGYQFKDISFFRLPIDDKYEAIVFHEVGKAQENILAQIPYKSIEDISIDTLIIMKDHSWFEITKSIWGEFDFEHFKPHDVMKWRRLCCQSSDSENEKYVDILIKRHTKGD